ncbi:MAG: type I pullulanase [Clostridia bacterium]|nr:type I pullulanase [Clostridia bacterium]
MKIKRIVAIMLVLLMTISIATQASAHQNNTTRSSLSTDVTYSGNDLGATYTKEQTTFKVWSPTATKVVLNRYATGSNSESGALSLGKTDMTLDSKTGVWSCVIKGDIAGTYYTYSVTVDGKTVETQDVYSYAVGVNGERSMVVDLASTNPTDWENDKHVTSEDATDAVIWEVHVRDFSISATSGVNSDYKGKYLAFTEGGTVVDGNTADAYSCIDYLVNQGVKYIHLNPVYDYGSVDETRLYDLQYNWGYDPVNYNVPEGSYSTNPYDGNVRIKEFKQMIQALHDRGIGVIMDVVYNHTYSTDSCLQNTVPDYYYRIMSNGTWYNGSGCGNETKSEAPMYRKYMIDSVTYWAKEYHIDGFRFDLMGLHDYETMNLVRDSLDNLYADGSGKNLIMYGEPWTGGSCGIASSNQTIKSNASKISERIGFFNDPYRDAVKGSTEGSDGGFVQTGSAKFANILKAGLSGNVAGTFSNGWTAVAPSQSVLYQSAHDNLTLFDKFVASLSLGSYDEYSEEAEKLTMLSEAITLTGNGIPFALAGEEFCRTKLGEKNSYNSPDTINAIDWERTKTYSTSTAYYKGLLEIRDAYSPFTDSTTTSAGRYYFCHNGIPESCLAYTIDNKTKNADSEWNYVGVVINAGDSSTKITLEGYETMPKDWVIVANDKSAGLTSLGEVKNGAITVPAKSAMILVDKESFDKAVAKPVEIVAINVNHINKTSGETLKSTKNIYHVGDTFRISPDNDLCFYYDYDGTEDTTTGIVTSDGATINFYYNEADCFKGTVTVNYLDESGNKLREPIISKTSEGDYYEQFPAAIQGYALDTSKLPANIVGIFGTKNVEINYYYNKLNTKLTVHYYNSNNWSRVYFYCYTVDGKEALRAWPGTKVSTKDDEGYNVKTIENLSAARFCFNNGGSEQDPAANMPGYEAAGEVWIKNGVTTFNCTVVTSYVDVNGKKVAEDDVQELKNIDSNTTYLTPKKDVPEYTSVVTPANSLGYCTPGTINVVYVYSGEQYPVDVVPTKRVFGDVDNNNSITLVDVTTLQRYIAKLTELDDASKKSADVNADNDITLEDVVDIQKYIALLLSEFKSGQYFYVDTEVNTSTDSENTDSDSNLESDVESETDTSLNNSDTETESDVEYSSIIRIYFSNSKDWKKVMIYAWNSDPFDELQTWPGAEMKLIEDSESGDSLYYFDLDLDKYDMIIFTNGSEQTVDIDVSSVQDSVEFRLSEHDGFGHYNVEIIP